MPTLKSTRQPLSCLSFKACLLKCWGCSPDLIPALATGFPNATIPTTTLHVATTSLATSLTTPIPIHTLIPPMQHMDDP